VAPIAPILTPIVQPVGQIVTPIVDPILQPVVPVITPIIPIVTPILTPVTPIVAPIVTPVLPVIETVLPPVVVDPVLPIITIPGLPGTNDPGTNPGIPGVDGPLTPPVIVDPSGPIVLVPVPPIVVPTGPVVMIPAPIYHPTPGTTNPAPQPGGTVDGGNGPTVDSGSPSVPAIMDPMNPFDKPITSQSSTGAPAAVANTLSASNVSRTWTWPALGTIESPIADGATVVSVTAAPNGSTPIDPSSPLHRSPADNGLTSSSSSGTGIGSGKQFSGDGALAALAEAPTASQWRTLARHTLEIPEGLTQNVVAPPG